jgi:hypothetical protein
LNPIKGMILCNLLSGCNLQLIRAGISSYQRISSPWNHP